MNLTYDADGNWIRYLGFDDINFTSPQPVLDLLREKYQLSNSWALETVRFKISVRDTTVDGVNVYFEIELQRRGFRTETMMLYIDKIPLRYAEAEDEFYYAVRDHLARFIGAFVLGQSLRFTRSLENFAEDVVLAGGEMRQDRDVASGGTTHGIYAMVQASEEMPTRGVRIGTISCTTGARVAGVTTYSEVSKEQIIDFLAAYPDHCGKSLCELIRSIQITAERFGARATIYWDRTDAKTRDLWIVVGSTLSWWGYTIHLQHRSMDLLKRNTLQLKEEVSALISTVREL